MRRSRASRYDADVGAWPLVLVLLGGCGRIGFDAFADRGPDAGAIDGAGGDAAPLGPFSSAVDVLELNQGAVNSEDPSLTDDLLEVVFSSTRPGGVGGVDVWTSTRASIGGGWAVPVLAAAINTASDDTTPEISGDGLTLVVASNRPGGSGLYDLYVATRASRGTSWSAPARITELASSADEFAGSLAPDRRGLVFASSRTGGVGAGDIYETTRSSSTDSWNAPTTVSIDSTVDDSAPWLSADGRTLYFGSTRAGGQGMQDIWIAIRPTPADAWTPPGVVSELSSADNDSDPWLSPDQRTVFFSRQAGSMRNIFMATR